MKLRFFALMLMISVLYSTCDDNKKAGKPTEDQSLEETTEGNPSKVFLVADSESLKVEFEKLNSQNVLLNTEELNRLYSQRDFSSLWNKISGIQSFHKSLKNAENEGLWYSDYHGEEIDELITAHNNLQSEQAARLELLLSDAFLEFARDLLYGKTDPAKLNKDWGVYREEKDLNQLLLESAETEDYVTALEELKPKHEVYVQLKQSLQEYQELQAQEKAFDKIPEGDLIKVGNQDPRIVGITNRLQELGLLQASDTIQDYIYSEELEAAVKKFQESKALQGDGIIGNSTIRELNMSASERYEQILANLERWRWYPRDLGDHYILINIPSYELAVIREGDTIREHNVIAGSPSRPTPIFSDTLQFIVINPQWHIPPTIKNQDVIPKAAKDASYLSSHNMSVKGPDGEKLDPASIDWSDPKVRSYSFMQTSGPTNPLGSVKIIYPNKYLIYLHDTPSKALFKRSERAKSSGCVRVENAIDLAAYVVEDQDWTKEKILEIVEGGKTKEVKVNRPIQVHHFYWTTWRAGGKTVFANDVYNLDKKIYSSLIQD